MTLHVCCPAYYPNLDKVEVLLKSGEKFGVKVHPFGVGKQWTTFWNCKVYGLREHLQTITADYFMVMDAEDTLIVRGGWDELPELVGDDVWVSMAKSIWPETMASWTFPDNIYVNGGIVVGPTRKVLGVVESIIAHEGDIPNIVSDQEGWAAAYLRGECKVDVCSRFGHVMSDSGHRDISVEGGVVRNHVTGIEPFVLHWAGRLPGREDMMKEIQL